ncbi:PLP-dependent aminotransferase family protein [Salinicoccus carnicancri]|uniref:MocR-like pyridoxine biosynthesis transcription factor PdxR n=1 Tax=Salinicoccus carnicancri TaxID=558170 RepID=UPI0003056349|nr:PLP-dependent aminotransferase family protein [Salinicoccus carnicancri]
MLISLDKNSGIPLFEQIYDIIRQQIIDGELENDERLPSKRQLQRDLSISQTTIENAYGRLLDEDLIYSREKSGYFVTPVAQLKGGNRETAADIVRKKKKYYTLPPGTIDTTIVQSDVLKHIAREVFSDDELLNLGDESGERRLREQIRHYLHINRGVNCSTDQIFIGPSTEFLLEQLLYLMGHPAMTIEDPGYPVIKKVLQRLGSKVDFAPVREDGVDVGTVLALSNPVVHVTPSHQFPSGVVLSLQKRIQLLNHADAAGSYIIEDDYDSEFRYTGRPLSSMQGLDQNDRTIYMSTFSKALYPSLRLSCMVLPKRLAELYYAKRLSCNVPRQMQLIVAHFMERGYLERHINRVRKIYRTKMEAVTSWLRREYEGIEIYGDHTGMHFMLSVPGTDLHTPAEKHSIVHGSRYSQSEGLTDTVLIGIGEKSAEEIMDILAAFLGDIFP